jgi:hypothetical protein
MYKRKQGQAAITDLFVAIGIFIVLITITSVLWNLYHIRLINRMDHDDIVVKTFQVSDMLLKTPGSPDNWDYLVSQGATSSDIEFIGVIDEEYKIPYNKITALMNLGEDEIKKVFHAGQYNFGLRIKDANSAIVFSVGKMSGGGKFSVNLERDIMYEPTPGADYLYGTVEVLISQ